ncbi:hypothetical protein P692DRAFT_201233325 [Suillus brevipes Sb2]|nr:hypothetical protein P692DRAFT_201233325 [Suillus brevipes Sb2]
MGPKCLAMSSCSLTVSSWFRGCVSQPSKRPICDIFRFTHKQRLSATRRVHHKSLLVCAQSDDVQKPEKFVDFFISLI